MLSCFRGKQKGFKHPGFQERCIPAPEGERIGTAPCCQRHDAQVKLLARDLAKAARHPVVGERPIGRHRERPDMRALGRSGGTELFNVTIWRPLSQARIQDVT